MELKEMIDGLRKFEGNEAFYLSERDHFADAGKMVNHPEIPESSEGER